MIMDIEKVVGITGDDLKQICDAYHEIKSNEEIQTLRAKVASAEVLVEALEALVDNFKTMENGFNKTLFDKARKALATYDKLSEVKHDTNK